MTLLARWNQQINLTSLDVVTPSDDAIDRLIVEPLAAAEHVLPHARLAIDVGSGGGSPAIPMKLARPALKFLLVESKARKAAFLREVVRHLSLTDVQVEAKRVEDLLTVSKPREKADLITVRGVRIGTAFLTLLGSALHREGRIFWFAGRAAPEVDSQLFRAAKKRILIARSRAQLIELELVN